MNVLLTPEIIAMEALAILRNQLVMKELVHTDYAKEFVKVGDTITIRKPAKLVTNSFDGTITKQDLNEEGVPVKLDRFEDVSVTLTSKEATLELKEFARQVVEPAMVALAQKIDEDLVNFAFANAEGNVNCALAEPTKLTDIANVGKFLDNAKAPIPERHLVMSPDHKYRYALTDNLSKVNYAGTNDTLRDALLGKIYTMNTYMDQNTPKSNAEVSGTAKGDITVASGTVGLVNLTVGLPATGTLKIGDGFIYNGRMYRFTADVTLSGGAKTNVVTSPVFPSAVTATVVKVVRYASSVGFHKTAFAFVIRPLDLPMGAARAAVMSGEGLSVRVVYGYDQDTKTDTISFDVIYGIANLYPDLAAGMYDNY